jgi:chromosome segregation ATPase
LISVQSAMLVALGFLAASLLGLLVASAFWSRAVRLTTTRIKQSMPVSEPEIKADRDRLRAEYAIKVHKLEMQLEQSKLERARRLIEINRRDASISSLETDMGQMRVDLEENQNARRVLEQTVADRLPRVEARLAEAKRLLFNRDREIAELTASSRRHQQALEDASSINARQTAQIERLSTAASARGGRKAVSDSKAESGLPLSTEIDVLRDKTKEQAALIDRLQRQLGNAYRLPAPARSASAAQPGDDAARAEQDIAEAESALAQVRAKSAEDEDRHAADEREIRALKARTDDQAGEIARLKSALAAFDQYDGKAGGLKDSKIGLKARLGSAQAQADQQAATIGKLRAELAAAHERLARQAAHFMDEMRRIGGTSPPSRPARGGERGGDRRGLADRVAQVRAVAPPGERTEPPSTIPRPNMLRRADAPAGNGHNGKSSAEPRATDITAAEMPKGPEIQSERRRPRLLERLTGLGKA